MFSEASFLSRKRLRRAHTCVRALDQTFSEVKALVRKKLGLDASQQLSLVQLRDGKEVDLEDGESYHSRMPNA